MGRYHVTRPYRSVIGLSSLTYVVFEEEGDVDVDDELAVLVNADSPGTLVALDEPASDDAEPADDPAAGDESGEPPADDTDTEADGDELDGPPPPDEPLPTADETRVRRGARRGS
jgi:hypothetical protein